MANDTLFRAKAPGIMNLLMADFALDLDSAAAILGNLGHESGGFKSLQEVHPTVAGSAGGYGWAQWTGTRRDLYEAYCSRHGFDPAGDTGNYKFLFVELKGSHRAAIPAVKNAVGLAEKVKAFELVFEVAGVKAYESRERWANIALDAYHANPGGTLQIADTVTHMPVPIPPAQSQQAPAAHPVAGFISYLMTRREEAREAVMFVIGAFNAMNPGAQLPTSPVKPAAAKTGTLVHPPSVLAGGLSFFTGLIAQLNGNIPPPVGDHATLPGILTTVLPIALTVLGGPAAGVGSRLIQGLGTYLAGRAKP